MPSKLKRAIGAVKDHTSISLPKVVNTNSATLEVAALKATTHNQSPIHERHVDEILKTVSSNRTFAGIAARSITKRLGKTKSWVVALKCLMLVLRVFQDGDPFFPKEVLHALNRKANILNRDESSSSPCDYAAFVKSFAAYLEELLDCFLTGKLQRRFTFMEKQISHPRSRRVYQQTVRHMKPPMLLDRISYWQRLLEKAIAAKPTGSAKTNRLVLVSFYAVVRESFDLYRDISNGLGLVLDVGRTSDYPSVHGISEELLETLKEFVKDQASCPSTGKSPSPKSPHLIRLISSAAKDLSVSEPETGPRISTEAPASQNLADDQSFFDNWTQQASQNGTSGVSFSNNWFQEDHQASPHGAVGDSYMNDWLLQQQLQHGKASHDVANGHSCFDDWLKEDSHQLVVYNGKACFGDWFQGNEVMKLEKQNQNWNTNNGGNDNWELVLIEATTQASQPLFNGIEPSMANHLPIVPQRQYNPFLKTKQISQHPLPPLPTIMLLVSLMGSPWHQYFRQHRLSLLKVLMKCRRRYFKGYRRKRLGKVNLTSLSLHGRLPS
ncbi:AP180 protein [Hibiscus syriacus]|uniref:AP180 protein n=1 Tax=Hibiscus syriacus TaxID=106335 RepID=A0A6A2WBB6_HIBSY|nr:AP180 protein [Hibiscus syriacus]